MTKCLMSICLLHTPSALRNVFCTVPLKIIRQYIIHAALLQVAIFSLVSCGVLSLCSAAAVLQPAKNWKLVLFKQNSHVTFSCTLYFVLIIKS